MREKPTYFMTSEEAWRILAADNPLPERNTMSAIDDQIAAHQAAIAKLIERQAQEERFGSDDDYDVGAVLRFEKKFNSYGRVYTYAALKTVVGWYVTGKNSRGWSWSELVEFMTEGVDEVLLCTQAEPI